MQSQAELIEAFYTAFQAKDPEAMSRCYHPDVHFSDPVFPALRGAEVMAMWRMLLTRASKLRLVFDHVEATAAKGSAHWVATYPFSKTGRIVVNDVQATFEFQDERIVRHVDRFDFWRWSKMALGPAGTFLGWSPLLRAKVQGEAARSLAQWIGEHP